MLVGLVTAAASGLHLKEILGVDKYILIGVHGGLQTSALHNLEPDLLAYDKCHGRAT